MSLQLRVHGARVQKGFSQKLWQVGSCSTEQGLDLTLQKPGGNPGQWALLEGHRRCWHTLEGGARTAGLVVAALVPVFL